jgi:UDP-N-acetylmuramoyl-L-alanyl-D-glutamate--2,6-diaminopimelate ligase
MSTLKDILYKVAIEAVQGSTDVAVNKIDSRKFESNDVLWLFVVLLVMVMTL